ncbi:hypothetical protein [Microtetraspora malaysiensis]|uniref:hypothetical protein n=1 Tax=Microtetraspora malaysiensis TaxID=161358 RepID=UPI00082A495B|nr:hypothetical protein [Microtetraspora malaysiensis]
MRLDGGLYVLAAVIVPDSRIAEHRAALRDLLLTKQPRLHWRDEGQKRRLHITRAIALLSPTTVVVIGTGLTPAKQRRARRKCLERLLWQLALLDLHQVLMERRNAEGNKEDLDMVNALRAQQALPQDMHVEWGDPLVEELLWLPDVVAGIVARAEMGDDTLRSLLLGEHLIERVICD